MYVIKGFYTEYGITSTYQIGKSYSTRAKAEAKAKRIGNAMVCYWNKPLCVFRNGIMQSA